MVKEQTVLIATIERRHRNWIRHVLRGESLLRTIMEVNKYTS